MKFKEKEFTLKNGITCQVRNAEKKDAGQFIEFRKKTAGESYFMMWYPEEISEDVEMQEEKLHKACESERDLMLMVFIEKTCAAIGSFYKLPGIKSSHRAEFYIAVAEDYQGIGTGNLLMSLILEKSREAGYEQIELSVYSDNEKAISLYEKFGFREWGRISRAYKLKDGTYRDSITMGLRFSESSRRKKENWLKWAVELQSLAQAGLNYAKDVFDQERYARIREISAEIIAQQSEISLEKVKNLFCNEVGYQTPKMDSRAAVFKDEKILMVKERDGKWSLPGGWIDVNLSVEENTVKEVREESGFEVKAEKIIAIQDGMKNNLGCGLGPSPYGVSKIFVLCSLTGENEFVPNIETSERNFFALDDLPELSTIRNTKKQIRMCFEAYRSEVWEAVFD